MATFICHCGAPATWLIKEQTEDGSRPLFAPNGWACCNLHTETALSYVIGRGREEVLATIRRVVPDHAPQQEGNDQDVLVPKRP